MKPAITPVESPVIGVWFSPTFVEGSWATMEYDESIANLGGSIISGGQKADLFPVEKFTLTATNRSAWVYSQEFLDEADRFGFCFSFTTHLMRSPEKYGGRVSQFYCAMQSQQENDRLLLQVEKFVEGFVKAGFAQSGKQGRACAETMMNSRFVEGMLVSQKIDSWLIEDSVALSDEEAVQLSEPDMTALVQEGPL